MLVVIICYCKCLRWTRLTTIPYLRELLDFGSVQREVREAVVFEKDGRLVRKALKRGIAILPVVDRGHGVSENGR